MTPIRKKLTGATALLGLAGAVLGGCGSVVQDYNPFIVAQWRQISARPDNHVERVKLEHIAAFQPTAIRLDGPEQGRLINFMTHSRLNTTDQIFLQAPATAEGGFDQVTAARLDVLRTSFHQRGLIAQIAELQAGKALGDSDQISIAVYRAVVVPPDCFVAQPFPGMRADYKVGCTTNASLGLMVADPMDLAVGRQLGPPDGEVAATAIERYRTRKAEEERVFIKEGTSAE